MHSSVSHSSLHPNQPPTIKVRRGTLTSSIFKHLTCSLSRVRFYWLPPWLGRSVRSRGGVRSTHASECYNYKRPGVGDGVTNDLEVLRDQHQSITPELSGAGLHRSLHLLWRPEHIGCMSHGLFASGYFDVMGGSGRISTNIGH